MSDLYIGTDIVDVERIKASIDNYSAKFLNKVFSLEEQDYCNSKSNPEIHYAGRFAAKEAIIKAVKSSGYIQPIPFNSIEIISGDYGEPIVKLGDQNYGKCRVSISHTEFIAMASAIYIIS